MTHETDLYENRSLLECCFFGVTKLIISLFVTLKVSENIPRKVN